MIIDLVIVIILFLFCVRSFRAGMRGELLGAIGWLLAIVAAIGSSEAIGNLIAKNWRQFADLGPYLSFIIVLAVLRLLLLGIIKLLPETLKGAGGTFLNLSASAIGFFKGAFFTSVILLLMPRMGLQSALDKYTQDAILYPHIKEFARQVVLITIEKIPNVKDVLDALG
ncbi:CvpA family protein [candidate division KSB1 bacterium]|nr:CvpA family protein [candidate division KSB1 bacterium]